MNFPDSLPCCHFHMGKAYPRNNVSELKLSGTKEKKNKISIKHNLMANDRGHYDFCVAC